MNQQGIDPFEEELRRHKPAPPPTALVERLKRSQPISRSPSAAPTFGSGELWWFLRRWLLPATAVLIFGLFLWQRQMNRPASSHTQDLAGEAAGAKADDVQIQQELLNSFDTVAQLPSGEPVRFRCREWMDDVVLRDRSRGLMVQQRTPRFEVVPVSFETY
jgi:hypothetical protein